MLTFYYAPKSVSLASHIALEESGAAYSLSPLDFSKVEQRSEDYLKINPKARVPALAVDEGIITETPAILAYIAQEYPDAKLAPVHDNYLFAKCQEFNLYLCSTVHVAHAHRVRGIRWADDEASISAMQKKVPQNMNECIRLIEAEFFQGPWVLGSNYSICDAYLFTIVQWLKADGVDIANFPKLNEFNRRMKQRKSVLSLQPIYGF